MLFTPFPALRTSSYSYYDVPGKESSICSQAAVQLHLYIQFLVKSFVEQASQRCVFWPPQLNLCFQAFLEGDYTRKCTVVGND